MKLTSAQKIYERWAVRESVLSSISKSSISLLTVPGISFYEMLVNGKKIEVYAILTIMGIIAFRACLQGVLRRTRFRLELAKKLMDENHQAP